MPNRSEPHNSALPSDRHPELSADELRDINWTLAALSAAFTAGWDYSRALSEMDDPHDPLDDSVEIMSAARIGLREAVAAALGVLRADVQVAEWMLKQFEPFFAGLPVGPTGGPSPIEIPDTLPEGFGEDMLGGTSD